MSEKIFDYESDHPEETGEIEVADMRHSRELAEPAPEKPEPSPKIPDATQETPAPADSHDDKQEKKAVPPPTPVPEPPLDAETENEIGMPDELDDQHEHMHGQPGADDPAAAFEMEQLRLLFGSGLSAYLRGQLGLLFNFALISLGRMPNPATGIVATDLDKARLAIDVFEFIVSRIQGELQGAERNEVLQLVAELKYSFMQLAQSAAPKIVEPQS